MDCLLPLLFLGQPERLPPVALTPPVQLGAPSSSFRSDQKTLYGTPFDNQVYSENFTVGWEDGVATPADADAALSALETTWKALIQERNWQAPVSSSEHFIWVILTRDLSGTGFTTTYKDSNYPEGYPVIYLNPDYSEDRTFWASLSSHEMAHAIQYSYRDYSTNAEEPWYWEASAEWQAELALPENNSYGYQSIHYAEQPHLRYSSMENNHQYGMFVLNAFLEEHFDGPGAVKRIWELSQVQPDSNWGELISTATDSKIGALIAGMSNTMSRLDFEDGEHYFAPKRVASLDDGHTGKLAYLGTHYLDSEEGARVVAQGDVLLASNSGIGAEVFMRAGETLAVVGLHPSSTSYSLSVSPWVASNDSGIDSGGPGESPYGGCACKSPSSQKAPTGIFAALCLLLLRRRTLRASLI